MSKTERYKTLFEQIKALVADEGDLIANMANVAAMLHHEFGFWWTGFYRVDWRPGSLCSAHSKGRSHAAG